MANINIDGKDYIVGFVGNVNPDIEWEEGAVCFAGSSQWFASCKDNNLKSKCGSYGGSLDERISSYNYQLNTIKQGDYIEASEIDNQKYNNAVDVFELFGFDCVSEYSTKCKYDALGCFFDGCLFAAFKCKEIERKLTYQQIMAIGELKRLEIERDKEPKFGKNEDGSMKLVKSNFSEKPNSCEDATSKQEVRMQKNKPVVAQVHSPVAALDQVITADDT